MKFNEEHLGGNATKPQAVALVIKLRTRGYDVEYGVPTHESNGPTAIPDHEWQECLREVLADVPDDMEELPASYNASAIKNY